MLFCLSGLVVLTLKLHWPQHTTYFHQWSKSSASPDGPGAQGPLWVGPSSADCGLRDTCPPAQPAVPPAPTGARPSAQGSHGPVVGPGGARGSCMAQAPCPHHPASWLKARGAGRRPPNIKSHHWSHSLSLRGVAAHWPPVSRCVPSLCRGRDSIFHGPGWVNVAVDVWPDPRTQWWVGSMAFVVGWPWLDDRCPPSRSIMPLLSRTGGKTMRWKILIHQDKGSLINKKQRSHVEVKENRKIDSLLPISGWCPAAAWAAGPQQA